MSQSGVVGEIQDVAVPAAGTIQYQLEAPYRDGTKHVIFNPLDFMARLAALVPKHRVNLTRIHGVFAPNSAYRSRVTPGKRGKRVKGSGSEEVDNGEASEVAKPRAPMSWSQRLRRVFGIDVETCVLCGGNMRIIACIEDPAVIQRILKAVNAKGQGSDACAGSRSTVAPDG